MSDRLRVRIGRRLGARSRRGSISLALASVAVALGIPAFSGDDGPKRDTRPERPAEAPADEPPAEAGGGDDPVRELERIEAVLERLTARSGATGALGEETR